MEILNVISYVLSSVAVLVGLGAFLRKKGIGIFARKAETVLEKIADGADGLGSIIRSAGLERVATVVENIGDVPDELGDVARVIAEMTENDDFTKEKFLELIQEGKDVGVEGKDLYIVISKKDK